MGNGSVTDALRHGIFNRRVVNTGKLGVCVRFVDVYEITIKERRNPLVNVKSNQNSNNALQAGCLQLQEIEIQYTRKHKPPKHKALPLQQCRFPRAIS